MQNFPYRREWTLALTILLICFLGCTKIRRQSAAINGQTAISRYAARVAAPSTTTVTSAKSNQVSTDSKRPLPQRSVRLGPYLLTLSFDEDYGVQACAFKLSRGGKVEYRRDSTTDAKTVGSFCQYSFMDPNFLEGTGPDETNSESILDGTTIFARDINQDGLPVLVASAWTGGNGIGNSKTILIQLGPRGPKQIYFGDPCKFERNHNGKYKITSTVLYSGGASPPDAVYVIVPLVWDGKSYITSTKLLSKPRPTSSQLAVLAAKIRKQWQDTQAEQTRDIPRCVDASVLSEIIGLIFSGNAQSAHALVDLLYPGPGNIKIGDETGNNLSSSELWKSIIDDLKTRLHDKTPPDDDIARYLPIVKKLNAGLLD